MGDLGASSSAAADHEEDEHAADVDFQHEDLPEAHQDARPSVGAGNQEERMQTMSPFERPWLIGLIALWRIKGISMIFVSAISRGLITGLTAWMHVS